MPLLDNMKAPLVAELDVSEVNRELKQFIEISINSTYNDDIEEMIIKHLGLLKSMMLKQYSHEQNRTKHMYDNQIVNMMDSFKARQDNLQKEVKEYLKKEFVDFQENTDGWKNNITQTLLGKYIIEVSLHGKHTEQSSEFLNSFPASNAIDGDLSTFSHTSSQNNPFWILDLGIVYTVKLIEVFARMDCCGNYIHDMDITVGATTNNMTLCTHYNGPASTKEQLMLKCKKPVDGRFVKLSISAKTAKMALAEVKVFAFV
ncbi:fucolectin-2-like [Mytilus trossulus]|uniref:fucolectin-2-like n=1 Tax=Mytilus trossulus TaxID=6551 RepID=UPI003003CBD8